MKNIKILLKTTVLFAVLSCNKANTSHDPMMSDEKLTEIVIQNFKNLRLPLRTEYYGLDVKEYVNHLKGFELSNKALMDSVSSVIKEAVFWNKEGRYQDSLIYIDLYKTKSKEIKNNSLFYKEFQKDSLQFAIKFEKEWKNNEAYKMQSAEKIEDFEFYVY